MQDLQRVVVAVPSRVERHVLDYVEYVARWHPGASFHLLHVLEPDVEVRLDWEAVRPALPAALVARRAAGRLTASTVVGTVPDALLSAGRSLQADLLVLGSGSRARRPLLRRLAMAAPFDLLMVPRPVRPPRLARILVPVDFSAHSALALQHAAAIAARMDLEAVDLLHVRFNDAVTRYDGYDDILLAEERETYSLFVARIDLGGVEVRPVFREAPRIARAILETAAELDSDLLVMATRGRSRAASVLLGSEADEVLLRSSLPVLAIKRGGAARPGLLEALLDPHAHGRHGLDPRFS